MGCTPSTHSNGDNTCSRSSQSAGSVNAVYANMYEENNSARYVSQTTFTCPSVSDHDSSQSTCRLFCLNINCFDCSKAQNRDCRRIRKKPMSASLTGLHSLDPESTGRISECGTNSLNPQLSASVRSSCASVCSDCDKLNATVTRPVTFLPTAKSSSLGVEMHADNNNNNTSTAADTFGSNIQVGKSPQTAPFACRYCSIEANINLEVCNSVKNKNTKKKKPQSKRIGSTMCGDQSDVIGHTEKCAPFTNSLIVKDSTLNAETYQQCCRKHQHRFYRQNLSQQRPFQSACAHNLCYSTKSLPLTSSVAFDSLQSKTINQTPMISDTSQFYDTLNDEHKFRQKCKNAQSNTNSQYWNSFIKFGRMNIEVKKAKILMVFKKVDSQAHTLRLAAEHVDLAVKMVDSNEAALNAYVEMQPELVIIDARHYLSKSTSHQQTVNSKSPSPSSTKTGFVNASQEQPSSSALTFNAIELCKSIRNIKGSEFTCILALVKRNLMEKDEFGVMPLLQSGFNRCLAETCHFGWCVNELFQLREYELSMQRRLRAANTLFAALDACKDGVVITGPGHDIQFANNSIEKMFGFRLDDIIGQKTQEYFQTDLLKADIDEKINNYNEGKEWEGHIYHRRKSGDSVPIWNRILPINYHKGIPEYIVYVKESPFLFIEKLMSPETESSHSYGSLKGLRKTSFDVKSEARRPSLAKFNSISLIEAPITRVINTLIAIKESGPNFLAPTLEKAIDTLKNSEVFMPQLQNCKPDDQLTSELVSSLINTNKSGVRRMSHEAASNKSSISNVPQTPTYTQPSLSNVPANIQNLLDNDLKWNFDVIELERITSKRPLVWLGLSILNRFNICQTLQCSETTLRNWLSLIESKYHDNPYHNSTHAADVMQATAYFLMSDRLKSMFDSLDQAICLLAAIIHDIDHPGRNSAFLSNSNHELAILYNDISVLESHHAAYGFKLTVGPNSDNVNIFKNLDRDVYRDVRQSLIDMVLATEMTKHFEHLSKFVHVFQANIAENDVLLEMDDMEAITDNMQPSTSNQNEKVSNLDALTTPENIVLVKRMLIKCADVSNPGRPLKLCEIWAKRIASEYCDQTEEEKRNNLPLVMPTFDSKNCSIPKSQIGFINYFANEMFLAWHSFGNFPEMLDNMNINYKYWQEQQRILESKQQKKLSLESDKLKESDEDNASAVLAKASLDDQQSGADVDSMPSSTSATVDDAAKHPSAQPKLANYSDSQTVSKPPSLS